MLAREGLQLRSKEEIKELKKSKNADFSKVFINLKEEAEIRAEEIRREQDALDGLYQ